MFHKKEQTDSASTAHMQQESYLNNEFLPLNELVYAPLQALANANSQLQAQTVKALKNTGTLHQSGTDEVVHLDSLNIAYEQVLPETEDEYSVDTLQMKLPILSMLPMSNLNIDQAEIAFSAEIRTCSEKENSSPILARICSPEQRDSDFLPRISYQLKLASVPAAEGLLRLTDRIGNNPVAKKMDTTPINAKGNLGTEEQKTVWMKCNHLRMKIQKLKQLYKKVSDMMTEQEKMREISQRAFEDNVYDFDADKYRMVQGNIANRIMKYQTEIMDLEIHYGLEHDYE